MNASRRAGSARPSSFLAFCHDNLSRCKAARMVSRQRRRPNRSHTNPARRRNVQRGFGSAPATGGRAACRCAVRTASPRAAAISGQRGGGHRCADIPAPRGRAHCKHAASPSRSVDGEPCVPPRPWRSHLARSHAEQGNARGCEDERRSRPDGANPPASGPSAHDQRATSLHRASIRENRHMARPIRLTKIFKLSVSNWTRFSCIMHL
jgi:hypothetical protein